MIHLDSCFLIDLQRETARERPGAAVDLVESLDPSDILAVSVHVVCELRAGAELSKRSIEQHEVLDQLLGGLLVVHPDERFAPMYARLLAAMRTARQHVAAMDLLIGTAALVDNAPLVTRNASDFSRIPGLRLIRY